jgi:hypothetical protein
MAFGSRWDEAVAWLPRRQENLRESEAMSSPVIFHPDLRDFALRKRLRSIAKSYFRGASQPVSPDARFRVSVLYLLVAGVLVVKCGGGCSVLQWMFLYLPQDISGFGGLLAFLRGLRTGVPPLLAALEIVVYQQTHSLFLVTEVLYRAGLVLAYLIAIHLFSRSLAHLLLSSCLSVVFLWATTLIHPQNAVVYDVFFPLFALCYFFFLIEAANSPGRSRTSALFAVLSGFSLTCLELCRPFALIQLPLLIACSWRTLRRFGGRRLLFLHFMPLVLLSGGWHAKLFFLHEGQILWSNHAGVNLWRAWGGAIQRESGISGFHDPTYNPEDRPNLNTSHHLEQSRAAQNAVLSFMLRNPVAAASHTVQRLGVFLKPRTQIYNMRPPEHPVLLPYKLAVWGSSLLLLAGVLRALWSCMGFGRFGLLLVPRNAFLLFTASSVLILAVGEINEEARLLLSVLPLLACVPWVSFPRAERGLNPEPPPDGAEDRE